MKLFTISSEDTARMERIETHKKECTYEITEYDDLLVRKLVECIRVIDKEKIEVVFKGEKTLTL